MRASFLAPDGSDVSFVSRGVVFRAEWVPPSEVPEPVGPDEIPESEPEQPEPGPGEFPVGPDEVPAVPPPETHAAKALTR